MCDRSVICVVQPILGWLHCGIRPVFQRLVACSHPADPRLAPLRPQPRPDARVVRVVIQPILGWLHCGWRARARLERAGHPADPRPAPLRLDVRQVGTSAVGHPADPRPAPLRRRRPGLDAAPRARRPADPRPAPLRRGMHWPACLAPVGHPADPRPAPLRRQSARRRLARTPVIQPILGRLHCGVSDVAGDCRRR